jgi:hypothetical protein
MSSPLPDPSKIKLITTDIDGTLLDDQGKLTERTISVIQKVLKKYPELHFVLASGRGKPAVESIRNILGIMDRPNTESILLNGCIIYDSVGNIIHQKVLPVEFVLKFHDIMNRYSVSEFFYSSGDDAMMFDEERARNHREKHQEKAFVVDKEETIKKIASGEIKVNKSCFICEIPNTKLIVEELEKIRKEYDLEAAYSTATFLEFMPNYTHKGTGLTQLINSLNIKKEEVIAFGDGGNDIELLKSSGWPIAMENACDELKSIARLTTKSNIEDGVADMLERIFLKN